MDLKRIISDPQQIDNIGKRVERLVYAIENVDFDIFNPNLKENFEAMMEIFHKEVKKLDNEGVGFISQSFKMI